MPGIKIKDDRERWRQALDRVGVDQVRAMLRERPNTPRDEAFPNLFPSPPYPTRGFVQDWVLEQENRIIRFSKPTILILLAALAVVLMFWFASSSLDEVLPQQNVYPSPFTRTQE